MKKDASPTITERSEANSPNLLLRDRIEREIREEISRFQGVTGAMLPTQEELVVRYGTSLRSVRDAMDRLKKENLIRTVRGKGTIILDPPRKLREVLVVCDSACYPYQLMCIGILAALLKGQNCTMNLVVAHDPVREWPETLSNHPNAQGAIFISPYPREALRRIVAGTRVPLVYLSDLDETFRGPAVCDTVVPDSHAHGCHCANHLIRLGHRRIAVLGWELKQAGANEFLRGYRDTLEQSGYEFHPEYVTDLHGKRPDRTDYYSPSPIDVEDIKPWLDRWFQAGNPPTALIYCGASETPVRDMLDRCLPGHFAPDAMVAALYLEQLQHGFNGLGDATAICVKFEALARRALELLFRPRQDPEPSLRDTLESICLCRRKDGHWTCTPIGSTRQ